MERFFWNPTVGNGVIRVGDEFFPFFNSFVRTSDPKVIATLEKRKDFYEIDKEAYQTKIGIRSRGAAFAHKQANFIKPKAEVKVEPPKVEKAPEPVKEEEPAKEEPKVEEPVAPEAEEEITFSKKPKNKKKAK